MGVSVSTTSVDNLVKNAISVINSTSQSCVSSSTGADNRIIISGCTGSNDQFFINNQQILSQTCLTNASTQVAVSSNVSQSLRQSATALTQQFGFFSVSDAQDFINSTIELADHISNTYNSTCIAQLSGGENSITCTNSSLNNTIIGINDYQSSTQSCILNAVSNSTAYNKVINNLQQSAFSKQANTFAAILFAFVAIIGIFAFAFINLATDPMIQWIIVIVILFTVITAVVYTATAKQAGNYPYRKA